MTFGEREHLQRVRERFTRTAQQFAEFALATRGEEAERLAAMAKLRGDELALDLACGPGTFARAFAPRVRFLCGLDLTPAMLEQARQAARHARLQNVAFVCGDASALPFAAGTVDLAICGYSLHHFLDPAGTVAEMAGAVRRGGRIAVADLIVPQGGNGEQNNQIERARDASHARTLTQSELGAILEAAGLSLLVCELGERLRKFDEWMQTVGQPPGTPAYAETRGRMEGSIAGDTAGFHPRLVHAPPDAIHAPELEFVQTSLFVVAEKR